MNGMHTLRFILMTIAILSLSACSDGMPKLFWGVDEGKDQPAYAQGADKQADAKSRAPLDVPPELRADLQVPEANAVGANADPNELPEKYRETVAGKAVALDARVYDFTPAQIFSATVDAMTSLNLPVESVDSPSGVVTTDWIRRGANNPGVMGSMQGIFGGGDSNITRHRFIVRVFRATLPSGIEKTRLEIRVLAQAYINGHWANKPIQQKVTDELFSAVEEQLKRMQTQASQPVAPNATPADIPAGLPQY